MLGTGGRMDAHAGGVAVLTGDRRTTSTLADGILDFLNRTLVTGMAVREMGGEDLVKGRTRMAVAGNGAVGGHAQLVMSGVGVVEDAAVVAGHTLIRGIDLWYVIASG